jgi:ribosomal protein S18 acetylase RimI-like enzyme
MSGPSGLSQDPQSPLRLSQFDWAGFVEKGFFTTVVGGAVTTALALTEQEKLPDWMIHSTLLLFLSLGLAFIRVWKTNREEGETTALWGQFGEAVSPTGGGMKQVKDNVFEIPYLFSTAFLSVSIVSLQTFAVCLLFFYISDNYYNLALRRGVGGDNSVRPPNWIQQVAAGVVSRSPSFISSAFALLAAALESFFPPVDRRTNTIDRLVLVRFFGRRARLDMIAIWLLVLVMVVAFVDPSGLALSFGTFAIAALLVMEFVVEPFRGLGVQYENKDDHAQRLVWTLPRGALLDETTRAKLTTIHQTAFDKAERQYEVEDMIDNASASQSLILLTEGGELAGYLFLEARPRRRLVFLWYLAIDHDRRGRGLGAFLVQQALDVVRERWPWCRAVFLETEHPDNENDLASDQMRRVSFYQKRLGFSWVRGLRYEIPAKGDPVRSLHYDPMYFPLRGDLSADFVKKAAVEMARDNFDRNPNDPRLVALKASSGRISER